MEIALKLNRIKPNQIKLCFVSLPLERSTKDPNRNTRKPERFRF